MRAPLFRALTRPQMFGGVTFNFFVINAAVTTELFLLTRSFMAFLIDAYAEDEAPNAKGGVDKRTVLRLDPRLAPVKAAVLPLSRHADLSPKARDLAAEPELAARLAGPGGGGRDEGQGDARATTPPLAERALVFHVEGFDWNCPQHITPRFTAAEVAAAVQPLQDHLAALEADNARLRARLPDGGPPRPSPRRGRPSTSRAPP